VNNLTNYKIKSSLSVTSITDPESGSITECPDKISSILASSFIVKSEPGKSDSDIAVSNIIKNHVTKPHDVINPITSFSSVSETEVMESIKHLKNKGGPGPDFIPMKFFKLCCDEICPPLSLLFTTIFTICNIPQCFKVATVLPLYKGKGSRSDPNNYRPISILAPIVKIFERIIFKKLLPLVEPKFIDQQHGYRTSRSCQSALTLFSQAIYNGIDGRNSRAGAVFVDLRKAFNSVDHNLLLKKMIINFDLPPNIIRLIRSYLHERVFRISQGSQYSRYFPDKRGIPQGSPLGNLLFTIFINDVESAIDLPFLLYADDLVFWTFGSNPNEIVDALTNTLSNLNNWCSENNLIINDMKTEFMLFHKSKDTLFGSVPNVELNGKTIQRTFKFRYLGVLMEPTMSFKAHFQNVESRLNSAIFKLQSVKRYVPELAMKSCSMPTCFLFTIIALRYGVFNPNRNYAIYNPR